MPAIKDINKYTVKSFNPEDASQNSGVVFARTATGNTYYLVTNFVDLRELKGHYAFRGKIDGVTVNFNYDGTSSDGNYILKSVDDADIATYETISQNISQIGDKIVYKDTIVPGDTSEESATITVKTLNTLEQVAVSVLGHLIQLLKDQNPLSINTVKIKLLIEKAFEFAYQFFNRSIEQRTEDVEEDESGEPEPTPSGTTPTFPITLKYISLYNGTSTSSENLISTYDLEEISPTESGYMLNWGSSTVVMMVPSKTLSNNTKYEGWSIKVGDGPSAYFPATTTSSDIRNVTFNNTNNGTALVETIGTIAVNNNSTPNTRSWVLKCTYTDSLGLLAKTTQTAINQSANAGFQLPIKIKSIKLYAGNSASGTPLRISGDPTSTEYVFEEYEREDTAPNNPKIVSWLDKEDSETEEGLCPPSFKFNRLTFPTTGNAACTETSGWSLFISSASTAFPSVITNEDKGVTFSHSNPTQNCNLGAIIPQTHTTEGESDTIYWTFAIKYGDSTGSNYDQVVTGTVSQQVSPSGPDFSNT